MGIFNTFGTLGLICKIGFLSGAFPYHWDKIEKRIRPAKSKFAVGRWIFVTGYVIFNSIFMFIRLIQCIRDHRLPNDKLFLNLFSVVSFTCASVTQINIIARKLDCPAFFHRLMETNKYFEGNIRLSSLCSIKITQFLFRTCRKVPPNNDKIQRFCNRHNFSVILHVQRIPSFHLN